MLAFFVRHGGTAEYHSFKTKLANAASLRSSMESESFCGQANAAFDEALERDSNLAGFVATQPVAFRMPYRACDDDMTSASATPDRSHRHTKSRHRTMRISDDSNNDGDQVGRKTAWVAPRGNGGNLADADR